MKKYMKAAALGAGLGLLLLASPAHAAVTASVSNNTVTLTATGCPDPAGATFTVTRPDGTTFDVSSAGSNTTSYGASSHARGTYRFSGKCSNGNSAGSGSFVLTPSGSGLSTGGGSKSGNDVALAAGTAMLGAAVGGLVLMRRRARA